MGKDTQRGRGSSCPAGELPETGAGPAGLLPATGANAGNNGGLTAEPDAGLQQALAAGIEGVTYYPQECDEDEREDQLKYRVEVYEESVVLTGYEHDGLIRRLISAQELAVALTMHMGQGTPILPQNTVQYLHTRNGSAVVLWRDPQIWQVQLQERGQDLAKPVAMTLPMPGLVFVCTPGQPPSIFAAKDRPESEEATLYRAPTFNTFSGGKTCQGNHRYPADPALIPESFFRSRFSLAGHMDNRSHKHPNNLRELWKELDGQREFPLEDLVQQGPYRKCIALDR